MKKTRIYITFFVLLLFAQSIMATTLSEIKLSDLGQTGFETTEPNARHCFETQFFPTTDLNSEVYSIVSVHAEFLPKVSKKSIIDVFLNEEKIGSISSQDFHQGWGRFNVPPEKTFLENVLKICGTTSFETTKIRVLTDSRIGYYLEPDFSRNNSFLLSLSQEKPNFLEEFSVKGTLKNYGSRDALVIVKYRKDSLEKETPETELVKGELQEEKIVPACQKRSADTTCIEPGETEFEYFLRPKVIGPITLLPSIAEYQNPFGETVVLESDRPTIRIVEPEIKIKPFLQAQKAQLLTGEKVNLKLIITNEGQNPIYNIQLKMLPGKLGILQGSTEETIESIEPKQTILREFALSSIEAGEFDVSCEINYTDYNAVKSTCQTLTIGYSDPALDATILGAGVLTVISVLIYVYLQLKK